MKPASPQQPAGATAPDKLAISNPAVPGQFVDVQDKQGLVRLLSDLRRLRERCNVAEQSAILHLQAAGVEAVTMDEAWYRQFRIAAINTLCVAYDQEHDWTADVDPGATAELLADARSLAADLFEQLGATPVERPAPVALEPMPLPF